MASSADPLSLASSSLTLLRHTHRRASLSNTLVNSLKKVIHIPAPYRAFRIPCQQSRGVLKASMVQDMPASQENDAGNGLGDIPVIDMKKLRTKGDGRKQVVEEIGRACEEWGFFHVVNHDVAAEIIQDMWEAYSTLMSYSHELSPEDRAQIEYTLFPREMREMLLSNKDSVSKFKSRSGNRITLRFREVNPADGEASPALKLTPMSFRAPACEFYTALIDVGRELLEAISESLGLPSESIYTITGENAAINSSIHYYGPCLEASTGLTAHKDVDTLTVLLPDPQVGGLQVFKDECWVDVNPVQGSLIINVGEVLQVITNGKYKSVLHRVINNVEKERSSIACFMIPTPEAIIGPQPQFIDEKNPARYPYQSFEDLYTEAFAPVLHLMRSN